MIAERLIAWAVRSSTDAGHAGETGRLVYVSRDGQVTDLGPFEHADLVTLAWSRDVAYRLTRDRGERSRLAQARDAGARLASGARRIAK